MRDDGGSARRPGGDWAAVFARNSRVQAGVVADWTIGDDPAARDALRLAPPFDSTAFGVVVTGERDGFAWELRDGAHAVLGGADAVGHELVVRGPRGRGAWGAVGPRKTGGSDLDVSGCRAGGGGAEIAMLTVGCGPGVAGVRTRYVDGRVDVDDPTVSPTTGERWVVVCLAGTAQVDRVEGLAADGTVLATRAVTDPRVRARPARP